MSVPSDVGRLVSAVSNTAVGVTDEGGKTAVSTFKYLHQTIETSRMESAIENKIRMAETLKANAKNLREASKVFEEHADILRDL